MAGRRWTKQNMPGGTSAVVPPDPMPNSEVKRRSADGSVGLPHARVGNCQASIKRALSDAEGFLLFCIQLYNPYRINKAVSPAPEGGINTHHILIFCSLLY